MTELIEFINWDKERLTKELEEIEARTDIDKFHVTKEEQKRFWFTVFLPAMIALAFTIFAFICAGAIESYGMRVTVKILTLIIGGFAIALQTFKIFSFDSWRNLLIPPVITPEMNFHKCIYGKTVKDISLENYPFHDKLIVRPKYLVLSDEEGNETKYWFAEEDWSFVATDKNKPVVDLEDMVVFCPLAEADRDGEE